MTNTKADYVLVMGDDWEGLYENGIILVEGHRIPLRSAMEHLAKTGNTVSSYTSKSCDNEWLEERGSLPENLSDVVWY